MKKYDWSTYLLPAAILASSVSLPAYANDYLSAEQAQVKLFPKANSFVAQPLKLNDSQRSQIKSVSGMRQRWSEQKIWRVESDGALQGWFLIDDVIGKHEFITYATAISPDGHVLGIEIMSYRETHGGQIRDASWRNHFFGKQLSDPFKLDEDVPNISGATLSCRNVLDGVKRMLAIHQLFLAHG